MSLKVLEQCGGLRIAAAGFEIGNRKTHLFHAQAGPGLNPILRENRGDEDSATDGEQEKTSCENKDASGLGS